MKHARANKHNFDSRSVVKPTDDTLKKPRVKKSNSASKFTRVADTYLIKERMLHPLKKHQKEITLVEITDRLAEQFGIRVTPDAVQKTIARERNNPRLQRAIARVLGLPFNQAFPRTSESKGKKGRS